MALRPYQLEAVDRVRDAIRRGRRRILIALPTGGGKCLALGTKVILFDGTIVNVEDVVAGDRLLGPDSLPKKVLSTTVGRGPMYRITPVRGLPWECNDVHVLTLVNSATSEVVDIDVQSYLAKPSSWKHVHKQFSPANGVDFKNEDFLPIDPYFLGVWFGDGTKRSDRISVSKPDQEIESLMHEVAMHWGLHVRTERIEGKCPTFHIVNVRGAGNPLLVEMRRLVPDVHAIPHRIRVAVERERAAFLAGVIDTDGYLHNGSIEIVKKHFGIADGITFIARSLGLGVHSAIKIVNGEKYYRLGLSGDFTGIPTRIARKTAAARTQKKCATRTGFSVVPIGDGNYAGFELDGDGRFLLGDFTVTHNTVIASHIIANTVSKKKRTLFVAHRRELIAQGYRKIVGCTCSAGYVHDSFMRDPSCTADGVGESNVGVIMAGDRRRRPMAAVQVASIDTLRNRPMPDVDLVIVDEAHRALAMSYRRLQADAPKAVHIGLTATPYRADGKGLGDAYDEIVVVASPQRLIDDGFLVEPRVFTVPASDLPDLSRIRIKGGDYDAEALAVAVDQGTLVGNIVEHWKKLANGVPTVAFAASVEHSKHIAQSFRDAGVRAEHLDGGTPGAERDAILRRLDSGETTVVCNMGVLCEGWDQPSVKCCILARPTKSTGLYLQQAGRILRPFRGLGAIILDHAGCAIEHGLPQEERDFSLESKKKAISSKVPSCKTCSSCFAIVPSACTSCPACGADFPAFVGEQGEIQEADGDLVEVRPPTQAEKLAAWQELVSQAQEKGHLPGWAAYRYKDKFGTWPPASFERPAKVSTADVSDEDKLEYLDSLYRTRDEKGYKTSWVHMRFKAKFGHYVTDMRIIAS